MKRQIFAWLVLGASVVLMARAALGQSSSLASGEASVSGAAAPTAPPVEFRGPRELDRNAALEQASFIAVVLPPPRKFEIHDLITVIIQERKQFESDGETREQNDLEVYAELANWFRFYPGGNLGADQLPNGNPAIDFEMDLERQARGETDREDWLSYRLQVEVIDVKPNGVLVLEARRKIQHDEDKFFVSVIGKCRSEDVGPDNSILSSRVADLNVSITHDGITKDITERGWLSKIWGVIHPL